MKTSDGLETKLKFRCIVRSFLFRENLSSGQGMCILSDESERTKPENMFIKVPIYFEVTGQMVPDEVQDLMNSYQIELTKQIATELPSWKKHRIKYTKGVVEIMLLTAEQARRRLVKTTDLGSKS